MINEKEKLKVLMISHQGLEKKRLSPPLIRIRIPPPTFDSIINFNWPYCCSLIYFKHLQILHLQIDIGVLFDLINLIHKNIISYM